MQKVNQVIGDFNPSIVSSEIPYSEKGGSKVSTLVWQTDARVLHHSFRLDLISHSSKKHQVRDSKPFYQEPTRPKLQCIKSQQSFKKLKVISLRIILIILN